MPKAVKEKKRLHAPAVEFAVKNEKEADKEFDLHLKNLETIKAELPAPEVKVEETEGNEIQEEDKVVEPKLTKEEKRKKRRDNLLQKLNYASVEIQKQKEKKQKETPQKKKEKEEEETPLGLLTKDLITTLLEVEEKEEKQRELKRGDPVRAVHMTEKDRQDLLKKEIKQFTSVAEHPVFKANPLATITEHLTNSIALQKAKDAKEPPKPKQQNNDTKNKDTKNKDTKNKDTKNKDTKNKDTKNKDKASKTQTQVANEKRKNSKQQQSPNPKDKKKNLVSIQKSKKLQKKRK